MDQMKMALEAAGLANRVRPRVVNEMEEAQTAARLRQAAEDGLYSLLAWVRAGDGALGDEEKRDLRHVVSHVVEEQMARERAYARELSWSGRR